MKNVKRLMALALAFIICATTANANVADAATGSGITNDNTDGNGYYVKLQKLDGCDLTADDVYGITFYLGLDGYKDGEYPNGAVGPNSVSTGWGQVEFAIESKELVFDTSNNSVTYLSSSPVFSAKDFEGKDAYREFFIVNYGSPAPFSVKDWAILGKGGKQLWTSAGKVGGNTSSGDDDSDDGKKTTSTGKLPQTGVVSTSVFVGLGATLIGAGVALRKKEDEE